MKFLTFEILKVQTFRSNLLYKKHNNMAYRKKNSRVCDKADTRLASLKSIDEKMDLGNGLTAEAYGKEIGALRNQINSYNTHLSTADGMKNQIKEQEAVVRDWNERILAGVASKFGKNSDQYEKAGGVKKSERKKSVRKKTAA
jgi:hypothetical protein